MKIKTEELTGAALDWVVAKCWEVSLVDGCIFTKDPNDEQVLYEPSTDWAQGGPIIEGEKISLSAWGLVNWKALALRYPQDVEVEHMHFGETPLIAAMRCYVSIKLGYEVDVPEELV
jgi:hypothetical protein